MNTSSCTLSLKSVAVRALTVLALLALPLGPFCWGQARAASANTAAAEQTEPVLEVNHPTYVALGQTLEVSVLVTEPAADAPAEGEGSASGGIGSYTATLSYKDYTDPELTHQLGDPIYLTSAGKLTTTAGDTFFGVSNGTKGSGDGDLEVAPAGIVAPAPAGA